MPEGAAFCAVVPLGEAIRSRPERRKADLSSEGPMFRGGEKMFRDAEDTRFWSEASLDTGSRACLVIGESGANWSAGIASARRHGPNLALVTQWVGEAPRHFCQRVISRLAKRPSFASIIMVCNQRNDVSATEARQEIVRATGGAMSDRGEREITLICSPTRGGGIPPWAPLLAEHLPRHDQPLGLTVELSAM